MKATETTIGEVKKKFGVFFVINVTEGYLIEKSPQTSINFRRMLFSDFRLTFDESVNFHHEVFTGEFRKKGGCVEVSENLYNQRMAWVNEDDSRHFNTMDDLKLSLFEHYRKTFENFMSKNEDSFIFRTLKKEGWLKKLLLKTDIGQKVNFLITQAETLKGKTCDDLVRVKIETEYGSDNTAVIVPVDFQHFANAAIFDAYVIYKQKMLKVQAYLHSMYFDSRTETLNMTFETSEGMGYNFHKLVLKNGQFVFDDGVLFFEKQDAYNVARMLIEDEQKRLDEMRAQLEAV